MYRSLLIGLALAALSFGPSACSSDNSKSDAVTTETAAKGQKNDSSGTHSGAHVYQCPMHPEVVSDQPGTCPKCGMKLEHTDNVAGSGRVFEMTMTTNPATLAAGKPMQLAFQPHDKANPDAPVPLALVHEKKIHLIIVSRDLSEFYHEHPVFGADGAYTVPFTFKTGGEYVLFQDYTPEGDRHQLGRQDVTVTGKTRPAVKYAEDVMTWKGTGDYAATLTFDKPVAVGTPLALDVKLTRAGQPITDLENYLGALGHMVIISEDTKQYLHVHPMDQTDKGPTVGFHTQFEQAGRYRVFLQFNHGGSIHTADFVVNVAASGAAQVAPAGTAKAAAYECPMGCEGSQSDKPGKCPSCGMDLEKKA